jgi:adenosylcobinamide-GDP ribazoletransferase
VLRDLKVALLFLTRLPVRVDGAVTMRDLAAAVYAFPLVGAAVGLLAGLAYAGAVRLGLPALPAALIAIVTMLLITGALHEDGLADTADGLGAGTDRARALEIMADSRIGSFGALALMVALLARLIALAPMWDPRQVTAVLVAAAMASRALLPVVMLLQPSAKADGLAATAGRPDPVRVMLGTFLAIGAAVLLLPLPTALTALAASAGLSLLLAAWLGRRLGGCTGDTLGAVQQTAEISFLLAIMSRL